MGVIEVAKKPDQQNADADPGTSTEDCWQIKREPGGTEVEEGGGGGGAEAGQRQGRRAGNFLEWPPPWITPPTFQHQGPTFKSARQEYKTGSCLGCDHAREDPMRGSDRRRRETVENPAVGVGVFTEVKLWA